MISALNIVSEQHGKLKTCITSISRLLGAMNKKCEVLRHIARFHRLNTSRFKFVCEIQQPIIFIQLCSKQKKYTIIKLAGTQTDGQTKTDHDSNRSSKLMCEIHHLLQQESLPVF